MLSGVLSLQHLYWLVFGLLGTVLVPVANWTVHEGRGLIGFATAWFGVPAVVIGLIGFVLLRVAVRHAPERWKTHR